MFRPNKVIKSIAFIVSVLAVSFSLSYLVFAWTEPSVNPPNPDPNISTPLNIGSTGQSKAGNLTIHNAANTASLNPDILTTFGGAILNTGGAATGLIVQNGDVKIGNATLKGDGSVSTGLNTEKLGGYTASDLLAAGGGAPINSVDASIAVAPNSYAYVNIIPPAGETWRIKLAIGGVTGGSHIMEVRAYKYNGAIQTGGQIYWPGNTTTPGAYGEFEITNSNYLRLQFYASAGGGTGYYSYFGNRR